MSDEQIPEGASAEDVQKATEVAGAAGAAGAKAIESGGSKQDTRAAIDKAIEDKLSGLQITMSDQDKDDMVDKMIDRLDGMGAFAAPPADDAPPAAGETVTPEAAAAADAAVAETQTAPRKRTLAEKFAGI